MTKRSHQRPCGAASPQSRHPAHSSASGWFASVARTRLSTQHDYDVTGGNFEVCSAKEKDDEHQASSGFLRMYRHVYRMAEAVAEGAKLVPGAEVSFFQVAELIPDDVLEKYGNPGRECGPARCSTCHHLWHSHSLWQHGCADAQLAGPERTVVDEGGPRSRDIRASMLPRLPASCSDKKFQVSSFGAHITRPGMTNLQS